MSSGQERDATEDVPIAGLPPHAIPETIEEVIDIIHRASGAPHRYRLCRGQPGIDPHTTTVYLIDQAEDEEALPAGVNSPVFPQRVAVRVAGQRVDGCWMRFQSPLPSKRSGRMFHPRDVAVHTLGDLTQCLFLHLCVGLHVLRGWQQLFQNLLAERALAHPSLIRDEIDMELRELPHAKAEEEPPRLVFTAESKLKGKGLAIEIRKDLSVLMHPCYPLTAATNKPHALHTGAAFGPEAAGCCLVPHTAGHIVAPVSAFDPASQHLFPYTRIPGLDGDPATLSIAPVGAEDRACITADAEDRDEPVW